MTQTQLRPAPLATGTGLGIEKLASFSPDNTENLPEVQAAFVAARFGLDATRAKLTAELAWERP